MQIRRDKPAPAAVLDERASPVLTRSGEGGREGMRRPPGLLFNGETKMLVTGAKHRLPRCHQTRIEPGPLVLAGKTAVLQLRAAVHDDAETRGFGAGSSRVVAKA